MGWISKRHMETGCSIGPGGLSERKKGAPLRKIVGVIRGQGFDPGIDPDPVEAQVIPRSSARSHQHCWR